MSSATSPIYPSNIGEVLGNFAYRDTLARNLQGTVTGDRALKKISKGVS